MVFYHVPSERTRGNYLKLHWEKYRLDIRKKFSLRVARHWNKLLKGVVGVTISGSTISLRSLTGKKSSHRFA